MKFHLFHLFPYSYADLSYEQRGYKTLWLTGPNEDYDPAKGAELYQRYIDELALAEELGFDGVCINEHHQTQYSLMPSPNVIAGALTQRLRKAKILILGRALPIVTNPLNVAEEWAMLDNMSNGRIICGMVRGIGTEYHASTANPAYSLERFREAHDLIKLAWTATKLTAFEGKHYRFPYINLFPRTVQKPHPPIWIPSSGSSDALEFAAANRYTYVQFFSSPYEGVRQNLASYRELAKKAGYVASDDQVGWAVPIYVASTDEVAVKNSRPHIEALFNNFLAQPQEMLMPPGYSSMESARAVLEKRRGSGTRVRSIDELIENGTIIVGSVRTVQQRIMKARKEMGLGHLLPLMQFGTLPAGMTRESMDLFATEVMPAVKAELASRPTERA